MRRLVIWTVCAAVVVMAACDKAEQSRPEATSGSAAPTQAKPDAPKPSGPAKTVAGSGSDAAAMVAKIAASVPTPPPDPTPTTEPTPTARPTPTPEPTPTTVPTKPAFKVGDRVYGMWTNGSFYPGTIGKANPDGTFEVRYDDGDVSRSLPVAKLRHIVAATTPSGSTFKVGDTVYGMWTNGRYYPGKIAAVNANGTFRVNYNDGDVSPALPAAKIKPRKVGGP